MLIFNILFFNTMTSISQFERDDMIKPITDNMYILAEDGRQLGGQSLYRFTLVRESFTDAHGKMRYSSSIEIISEEL